MPALTDDERNAWDRAWRTAEVLLDADQKRRLLAHPDILRAFVRGIFDEECEFGYFPAEATTSLSQLSPGVRARFEQGEIRLSFLDYVVHVDYREKDPAAHLSTLPGITSYGHHRRANYDGYRMTQAAGKGGVLTRTCKLLRLDIESSHEEITEVAKALEMDLVDPRTAATVASCHPVIFDGGGRLCATGRVTCVQNGTTQDWLYARLERQNLGQGPGDVMYETIDLIDPEVCHFRVQDIILLARPLPVAP